MDYKDMANKEHLVKAIGILTNDLQDYLVKLLEGDSYKRSALIYYWLRDYNNYLKREGGFDSKYLPYFYRGNVVSVNLGFNIGSEMGGRHYAIVIRDSSPKCPTLSIMPLSSIKGDKTVKDLHADEVYLSNEIYNLLQLKCQSLMTSIKAELATLKTVTESLKTGNDDTLELINKKMAHLKNHATVLKKSKDELSKLKHGSYGIVGQIKTVSKMRIFDPTNEYSVLYGVKVSTKTMNKIDKKIIETYTRSLTSNDL